MDAEDVCRVFRCFCEMPRLRILNLLRQEPLCVCHLQTILEEPQVKISKHLAYLKAHGLVESQRSGGWSIYSLASIRNPLLDENLRCLQDLLGEDPIFKSDKNRLRKTDTSAACGVGKLSKKQAVVQEGGQ